MSMTTYEKSSTLRGLKLGDVVKLTNGKEYEFIRMKQKKFTGKRLGQTYDIPVEMFVEVVSRAEKVQFDPSVLQEGELFYTLDSKNNATLYRFKYMINAGKVMAENPITGTGVRMDATLAQGAVNDLARKR
jgi:hypothetical protein